MLPIKYLSLQKSELEYEVRIRGATPASSVEDLRKQIIKLSTQFPSECILESPLEADQDLNGCLEVITKVQINLDVSDPSASSLLRTQNMLNHLHNRLERITCSEGVKNQFNDVLQAYKMQSQKLTTLQSKRPSTSSASVSNDNVTTNAEPVPTAPGVHNLISVTCDRTSSDLSKLKFSGKSCVRAFIQRVDEFMEARNITSNKVLNYASEIFQDDALHWYRAVKSRVSSWSDLAALLLEDFGQADYDYRLISEIRSRTQGERENITIYLSIMDGMFSRLSKPLTEADQLEILLHNIRPCYASTLASSPQISSIDAMRSLCRNYETIQARLSHFQEPPKVTSNTLAPEFAYTKDANKISYHANTGYNQNRYTKYQNNSHNTEFRNSNYNTSQHKGNNYSYNQNNKNLKYVHAIEKTKQEPYCPRCRDNTHHIRQCQAPRDIVCFKCGMKNVKTPDCPTCNKNSKN